MKRWPTRPLGEVIELSQERVEPGEHPMTRFNYVGLENIEGHTGRLLPNEPTPGREIKSTKNIFHAGNILYGKLRPYLNKVHLATKDGICSTDIYVFHPQRRLMDASLLAHYLRSPSVLSAVTQGMAGANLPRIGQHDLLRVPIPVPPMPEQERIVQLLEEADELRTLRTVASRRTEALVPGLFNEMFGDPVANTKGWPVRTAGSLMLVCEYGTSQKPTDSGTGVPVLRMNNVTYDGALDLADLKTVDLTAADLAKYGLQAEDILFNRTNSRERVGKTGMWDGRFEAVAASYFIRLRLDPDQEDALHFTSFMNLPTTKQRLMHIARGAIGQANINAQELRAIELPVPPIELQHRFAERVAEIRELETTQASSHQRLDDLLRSLVHEAFAGEL